MIAGYERKEDVRGGRGRRRPASSLKSIPRRRRSPWPFGHPARSFRRREYGRALRTAEEVEGSRSATPAQAAQARLIQAEAAVFEGDAAASRGKADLVLAVPTGGADAAGARAKDLYLLSSLKETEGKDAAGDPLGAAAVLEEVSVRFPGRAGESRCTCSGRCGCTSRGGMRKAPSGPASVSGKISPQGGSRGSGGRGRPAPRGEEEFAEAGDLYEAVAERFPKGEAAPQFLFHAARLAEAHGPPEAAARRFTA